QQRDDASRHVRSESEHGTQTGELRLDLLEEDLEAIGVPKTMGQVGTQLVELFEKTAIIAENSERNSEAAHDAEIILFRRILKKRLQHRSEEHTSELQS